MRIAADRLDLGSGSERSQQTVLGGLLRANRDRRFGGLLVRHGGVSHGSNFWKVTTA